MRVSDLKTLYAYNYWARDKVLAAASQLPLHSLMASSDLSHGTILGVLTHVLNAECLWRSRCQQRISPPSMRFEQPFEDILTLRAVWQEEETNMLAYINGLEDRDLEQAISYQGRGGGEYSNPLWHILVQLVNHGTHHRSEVTTKLRKLGKSPGNLDFIIFLSHQKAA